MDDQCAVVLGLKESTNNSHLTVTDELERLQRINDLIHRINLESEIQQDALLSRFCATYLPGCVDKFLDPPSTNYPKQEWNEDMTLDNAFRNMLVTVQHIPYFSKSLRSTKPVAAGGKRLPRVLAERLVAMGPRWDEHMLHNPPEKPEGYFEEAAGLCVQLLDTLLVGFSKTANIYTVIPQQTREALAPLLRKWARRYRNDFLGDVSQRAVLHVAGTEDIHGELRIIRRQIKNWDHCGLPNCNKADDLKACGKCQTVRYCSPEHQRAHWNQRSGQSHKQLCYRTEY